MYGFLWKAKHYGKDKSLLREQPNTIWEEFLIRSVHPWIHHKQGAPSRIIWQWGHRTCRSTNQSLNAGISSSPWPLGWLGGPSGVSPVVQEAVLTHPHLLPADHVSALIELPPCSRKGLFHDLIQPGWWYLKAIPGCGCLPSGERGRQLIGHWS